MGETILVADCSMEHILSAKSLCDVAGHYSRPDIFPLTVQKWCQRDLKNLKAIDIGEGIHYFQEDNPLNLKNAALTPPA